MEAARPVKMIASAAESRGRSGRVASGTVTAALVMRVSSRRAELFVSVNVGLRIAGERWADVQETHGPVGVHVGERDFLLGTGGELAIPNDDGAGGGDTNATAQAGTAGVGRQVGQVLAIWVGRF